MRGQEGGDLAPRSSKRRLCRRGSSRAPWRCLLAADRALEQELDDLDVPDRLRQRGSPSVQPVAPEQEAVAVRDRSRERARRPSRPAGPCPGRCRGSGIHSRCSWVRDARQPLQHLVALDRDAAARRSTIGQERAPDRVRVHHRAAGRAATISRCSRVSADGAPTRRRRSTAPSSPISRMSFAVSAPLCVPLRVIASRTGSSLDDDAEVAAGAEHPAARVEALPDPDQAVGRVSRSRQPRLTARRSPGAPPRCPSAAPARRASR